MSAHGTKIISRTRKLAGLTVGAGACLAALTIATPANAQDQPERPDGPVVVNPKPVDGGFELTSAAAGALGGITLAGAGLAIAAGLQRRRDNTAAHHA
ncbi:MAG TPA: hypothetical protein VEK80_18175 [Kribbellaceae bacterium]|nr:hypothetical protein [Kribbellaceae bacterium]